MEENNENLCLNWVLSIISEKIVTQDTNDFGVGLPCTSHYLDDLENFTSFLNKFLPDKESLAKESSKTKKNMITELFLKTQLAQLC